MTTRRPRHAVDEAGEGVAENRPTFEVGHAGLGDPERLDREAGDPDRSHHPEDLRVLGLGLDPDAVGPLDVAPHDRPTDTDEERDAGQIGHQRIAPVDVAVEELEVGGHLEVDLADGGDGEQHDEGEVHQ